MHNYSGEKIGYLGDRMFEYNPHNYLVTSVTMPFWCESFGSTEEPLQGLYIDIDMGILRDLIGRIDPPEYYEPEETNSLPLGIAPAKMDTDMTNALKRLLKCIQSESDAEILDSSIIREILYRVLHGSQGSLLYSIGMHNGTFSQIDRQSIKKHSKQLR